MVKRKTPVNTAVVQRTIRNGKTFNYIVTLNNFTQAVSKTRSGAIKKANKIKRSRDNITNVRVNKTPIRV